MNSRKKITEEQNPISSNIDKKKIIEILRIINKQDSTISQSILSIIPLLEKFISSLVESFINGGKLIYVGAGTSGRLGVLDASECPPTFNTDKNMVIGIIAGGEKALSQSIEGAEDDRKNVDWGELQVRSSGNFCNSYSLYTRFMGGINYQIEHHLFPTLSNHKLEGISNIVKQTCEEYNIPYNSIDNPKDVFKNVIKTYIKNI